MKSCECQQKCRCMLNDRFCNFFFASTRPSRRLSRRFSVALLPSKMQEVWDAGTRVWLWYTPWHEKAPPFFNMISPLLLDDPAWRCPRTQHFLLSSPASPWHQPSNRPFLFFGYSYFLPLPSVHFPVQIQIMLFTLLFFLLSLSCLHLSCLWFL